MSCKLDLELHIDWNANSISAALWLGEAKILVAGGIHERRILSKTRGGRTEISQLFWS